MSEVSLRIDGMYCDNCARTVAQALDAVPGVSGTVLDGDVARFSVAAGTRLDAAFAAVCDAGYYTDARHLVQGGEGLADRHPRLRAAGTFAIIVAAIVLVGSGVNALLGFNVFNAIPVIDSSLTYGALFTTGLLTGLHCLSMCGAINLAATSASPAGAGRATQRADRSAPVLYNLGRLASYTLLGALAGALGGIIGIDRRVSTVLILLAGAVMVALGLRMGGVVKFSFPVPAGLSRARRKALRGRAPLAVGLANGLMPCGPLQAMQLYALGTGSATAGALSMFVFCLGTLPFMLAIGFAATSIGGKGRAVIAKVAGAFMFVLALSMMGRGLSAAGVNVAAFANALFSAPALEAQLEGGVQTARFDLEFDRYANLTLKAGVPARIVIDADAGKLTGCNNEVIMDEWGIDVQLSPGENVIEFTPEHAGRYSYSCWMRMIVNEIEVID